jgi:hypothetical protein
VVIFGLYLLFALFLTSLIWACLPIRNPDRRLLVLLAHMGASALGFVWLLNLFVDGGGPFPYVTFGPAFVISAVRVLLMTTEWGDRITTRLARRQEPR